MDWGFSPLNNLGLKIELFGNPLTEGQNEPS